MDNKPMTERQVKYIRDLFNQVKDRLPDEKKANLVRIMKAHLDGSDIKDTRWASAAIDALKAVSNKSQEAKVVKQVRQPACTKVNSFSTMEERDGWIAENPGARVLATTVRSVGQWSEEAGKYVTVVTRTYKAGI